MAEDMSDTRARQRSAFAIVTALAFLGIVGRAAPDVVAVNGGHVAGTLEAGVRVFKGLPYAAPPVGDLRWKPPQPIVPWTGVRDGAEFGAEGADPVWRRVRLRAAAAHAQ
jgi:para-nitrobenzyl esterase